MDGFGLNEEFTVLDGGLTVLKVQKEQGCGI